MHAARGRTSGLGVRPRLPTPECAQPRPATELRGSSPATAGRTAPYQVLHACALDLPCWIILEQPTSPRGAHRRVTRAGEDSSPPLSLSSAVGPHGFTVSPSPLNLIQVTTDISSQSYTVPVPIIRTRSNDQADWLPQLELLDAWRTIEIEGGEESGNYREERRSDFGKRRRDVTPKGTQQFRTHKKERDVSVWDAYTRTPWRPDSTDGRVIGALELREPSLAHRSHACWARDCSTRFGGADGMRMRTHIIIFRFLDGDAYERARDAAGSPSAVACHSDAS
ncbi:hypothetical protein C8Q76DRAFT_134245 [Earliella scabrosa]|nr:hypothetical protein C8Q76DRAFT_134245 [Earliella scabrosa]